MKAYRARIKYIIIEKHMTRTSTKECVLKEYDEGYKIFVENKKGKVVYNKFINKNRVTSCVKIAEISFWKRIVLLLK